MTAISHWWAAVKSGWRAGLKQFRKRRTELGQLSKRANDYQREAIETAQSERMLP